MQSLHAHEWFFCSTFVSGAWAKVDLSQFTRRSAVNILSLEQLLLPCFFPDFSLSSIAQSLLCQGSQQAEPL